MPAERRVRGTAVRLRDCESLTWSDERRRLPSPRERLVSLTTRARTEGVWAFLLSSEEGAGKVDKERREGLWPSQMPRAAASREPLLPGGGGGGGGGGGVGVGIGGSGDAADATLPPLLPSASSLNAPPAAAPLSLRAALYDAAVREEMAALFALALPTGLGIMARQLVPVVDAAVLGRLGTPFLAAASVAQIFTIATFGFVWQSVGSALNTLAAQADGAGERALVGLWLQTALAVAAVACALVSLLWAFGAAASLRLLGFDAGVSELAQLFVRWYLLFMWPNMAYIAVTNYLNSFSVSWPPLVANVALLCVNVVMNVLLVLGTAPFGSAAWAGIGFVGSPIASGATQAGVVALLVLFVRASPALHEGLWPGWRPREALAWPRVRTFMRQALPGFAAFFLQDAYLQLASLLAAELGPAEVAAHSALLQLLFALTCLIYGLTKATQVRVAALLGRGDARLARLVALLATAVCTAISAAVGLALVAARDVAGSLFSSDPAVIAAAREIALPCGLSYTLSECGG